MSALDETAIVVLAPESEPFVAELRARYDPAARRGVPAHVTLLYPFVHPDAAPAEQERLAALFAEVAPFRFALTGLCGFPGVLFLGPEPSASFLALTELLVAAYPGCPPYGGAFAEPVPHLTLAQHEDVERLAQLAAGFDARCLPIACEARDAWLLVKRGGRWQRERRFAFGGVRAPGRGA